MASPRPRPLPTLAAAALALLAGCGDPTGPGDAPEPLEALPRELSLAEQQVLVRSNGFGFHLLREVHAREDASPNVFLSPFSASMALGMTLNGAAGGTFDAMRATLGFQGLAQEDINRSYRDLTKLLLGLDPKVELAIANSAWTREGFPFEAAFFEALASWFGAEAAELDFSDPSALATINGWACSATEKRICKVLEQIRDEVLFLMNAVYFKGDWTAKFDRASTRPAPFRLADGRTVQVPRMRGKPAIGMGWSDGVTIGEIPYGAQAWVMNIILPPEDGTLAGLVADLDAATWGRWMASVPSTYRELEVELPRFELTYETLLNDPLTALGMGDAFSPFRADFSRLSPRRTYIDFVKQNAFLKVDEEGTEAAAVTTVGVVPVSLPPSLVVDRPFLLAIRERLSGTVLFLGAIGDPRGS